MISVNVLEVLASFCSSFFCDSSAICPCKLVEDWISFLHQSAPYAKDDCSLYDTSLFRHSPPKAKALSELERNRERLQNIILSPCEAFQRY